MTLAGTFRGLCVQGENVAQSDPPPPTTTLSTRSASTPPAYAAYAGLRIATRKPESSRQGRRSHVDSNRSGSSPAWRASVRNSENS
jgi:hypothetical protein